MEQSRRQRRATKRLHSMSDSQCVINFILALLPAEFACDYRVECDLDGTTCRVPTTRAAEARLQLRPGASEARVGARVPALRRVRQR